MLGGQLVQLSAPLALLYVPDSHARHVPPSGPVYPALHVQAAAAVLPAGEDESLGQLAHALEDAAPAAAE